MTNQVRLSAVVGLLAPTLCLTWGADGHRIVGEIASNYPGYDRRLRVAGLV